MDNLERNNESRHVLFNRLLGEITVQEPKGWKNDTRSYERDKDSRGIISKTTIDLEFFGDAAEWLSAAYYSFGIQEKVLLSKFEKDNTSINEKWVLRYIQEIDMGTFKEISKTKGVTVKATEGGLYDEIKGRKSKKYDIINKLSADGDDIGELKTYPFQPQPRGIFLETLMEDSQTGYRLNSRRFKNSRSDTQRTIPLRTVYNSDQENIKAPSNSSESLNNIENHDQNFNIGTTQALGDQIVFRIDRAKTIKFKLDLAFRIARVVKRRRVREEEMAVELRRSRKVGDNDILVSREILLYIDDHDQRIGELFTVNHETEEYFEEDESLSIVFRTSAKLGCDFCSSAWMDTYLDVSESKLLIQDETAFEVTTSRCIKPFDLFERIISKITGQNGIFKSTLFGEGGEYENFVVDNGFWARGFPDLIEESNGDIREIQFNTSFKEAFESFNYLEPLCWFTEIDGDKEVVRIEKATYSMRNFVGLKLEAVDKIVNESSKPDFFSSIVLGHKKSLEYEELNGLDEFNGLSEFGTHITRNESEYNVSSVYRFDAVGYELIRRFQYINSPKEDTPRDSDVFMHDAKWTGFYYTHNLWVEHFDSPPTGIFDPETAWNLRLSPMNRLYYGHGYSVARGLYHRPEAQVRFSSSNANKNLVTVMNGVTLYEGGDDSFALVKDLGKPRVEATKSTLTFKITQDIEKQLSGTTKIGDDFVPNFFGLIEYLEDGEKKYGRITKLEADDESKLTLIKARL